MARQSISERVLQIAREQGRTLEEPCLELECGIDTLLQRLDAQDRPACEEVSKWLGISYYSFFMDPVKDRWATDYGTSSRSLWDL